MANIEGARVRIYLKDGLVILFEISFCRVYIFLQAKIIALETDFICLCYLRVSGSTAMRLAENGDPSTAIVCLTLFGPDTVNVMERHGQCHGNDRANVVPATPPV